MFFYKFVDFVQRDLGCAVAPAVAHVVDDCVDLLIIKVVLDSDRRHFRISGQLPAVMTLHQDGDHCVGTLEDNPAIFKRWEGSGKSGSAALVTCLTIGGIKCTAIGA